MAKIGISNAIYAVEKSLTRTNTEISKNMSRLATGKENANAGDTATISAIANTLALDIIASKAALRSVGIMRGYLSTAISNLDAITNLMLRLQELAVLGANSSNSSAESDSIDLEAEAIADEVWRMAVDANYKNKGIFELAPRSEYLSLGGRDQEYAVSFGTVDITNLYNPITETLVINPSDGLSDTNIMTSEIESFQNQINTVRVELSSHYAALEHAENQITDLRIQYELSLDSIEQINFTNETAILARNQILQNAANAMLVQANNAQMGLIRLIE